MERQDIETPPTPRSTDEEDEDEEDEDDEGKDEVEEEPHRAGHGWVVGHGWVMGCLEAEIPCWVRATIGNQHKHPIPWKKQEIDVGSGWNWMELECGSSQEHESYTVGSYPNNLPISQL